MENSRWIRLLFVVHFIQTTIASDGKLKLIFVICEYYPKLGKLTVGLATPHSRYAIGENLILYRSQTDSYEQRENTTRNFT